MKHNYLISAIYYLLFISYLHRPVGHYSREVTGCTKHKKKLLQCVVKGIVLCNIYNARWQTVPLSNSPNKKRVPENVTPTRKFPDLQTVVQSLRYVVWCLDILFAVYACFRIINIMEKF